MKPEQKLAEALIQFDEDNPGDPEALIEIPFDVWAEWINLAGLIDDATLTAEDSP